MAVIIGYGEDAENHWMINNRTYWAFFDSIKNEVPSTYLEVLEIGGLFNGVDLDTLPSGIRHDLCSKLIEYVEEIASGGRLLMYPSHLEATDCADGGKCFSELRDHLKRYLALHGSKS